MSRVQVAWYGVMRGVARNAQRGNGETPLCLASRRPKTAVHSFYEDEDNEADLGDTSRQ